MRDASRPARAKGADGETIIHHMGGSFYVSVAPQTVEIVGIEVHHFATAVKFEPPIRDLFAAVAEAVMRLGAFRIEPATPGARTIAEDLDKVLVAS